MGQGLRGASAARAAPGVRVAGAPGRVVVRHGVTAQAAARERGAHDRTASSDPRRKREPMQFATLAVQAPSTLPPPDPAPASRG
jgi:hypothetical protein